MEIFVNKSNNPKIIANPPIIFLIIFSFFILLNTKGPKYAPIIEPKHKDDSKYKFNGVLDIKNQKANPVKQIGTSAKSVVATLFFDSLPSIICPVDNTGPKPPPDKDLLKELNKPNKVMLFQLNLNFRFNTTNNPISITNILI